MKNDTMYKTSSVLSWGKFREELKGLYKIIARWKRMFLELVSLDVVLHSESKRRKYKIMVLSVLIPLLLGGIRIYIKGHYADLGLWFIVAAALGLFSFVYFLWIVEGWTNLKALITVGSLLPLTVVLYSFFVNVVFSFSLRRLVFSVMFFIVLLILLLLVYFVGLMGNVLNTYMFKNVELGKVALGGLLFLYIFLYMIMQATLFLGIIYVVEGKVAIEISLVLLFGLLIIWIWSNVSIIFILWRSLGLALLWGAIFGVMGFLLPLSVFIILGKLLLTLVIVVFLPWITWETVELLVYRTNESNWWGIMLGFVLIVLLFVIF